MSTDRTRTKNGISPKPSKYLILQSVSLRRELIAMTMLCLHNALPRNPEDEIPEWPITDFEPGTACHGALLGQLENLIFAELLASHKSSWSNRVLGRLTVFAGVVDGVADPFPIFAWKVEERNYQFKSYYWARVATTQQRIGEPPSASDTSSQSSTSSSRGPGSKRSSLQKRTPYGSIPAASPAIITEAYWKGDWLV